MVCFFLNSKVRYADILDGSSNTFLIGEVTPIEDSLGWASGTRATLRNTSDLTDYLWWDENRYAPAEPPDVVGSFGSVHPWGTHFLMADGAVIFIDGAIDDTLYRIWRTVPTAQ